MHDAKFVSTGQSDRGLPNQLARGIDRERTEAFDERREINASDILHYEKMRPVDLTGVHGTHDVGMIKRADSPHLAFKAFDRFVILGAISRQHFVVAGRAFSPRKKRRKRLCAIVHSQPRKVSLAFSLRKPAMP